MLNFKLCFAGFCYSWSKFWISYWLWLLILSFSFARVFG